MRRKIIIASIIGLAVIGAGIGAYFIFKKPKDNEDNKKNDVVDGDGVLS